MDKLQAFAQSMRATAQYYPVEFDVAFNWNEGTRKWSTMTIKCDTCHKAKLEAVLKEVGGHIYRENGFFY